jgi:ketosteroid isomerase-like protein
MKPLFVLLICACLFSCTTEARMEKLKQEMMDADRSFSELSKEKGMNHAFETYCAEDGVILRPENMPYVGKQTIKELLQGSNDEALLLTWEPSDGKVSRSGDLGFTYGIYTMALKDGSKSMQGTYVSVWVKEDGQWRFALDTGNEGL